VQALDDVAGQAAGKRHQLDAGQDLGADAGHAPGHDQADIAGAQDDDALARHQAFQIDQALCRAGGHDPGAVGARDGQGTARALPAAHSQNNRAGLDLHQSVRRADGSDQALRRYVEDHRVALERDAPLLDLADVAVGVFRAGQLLVEDMQPETVVDALLQDAAQTHVALQDQEAAAAAVPGGDRRGQAGRPAADDHQVDISCFRHAFHLSFPNPRGAGARPSRRAFR